MHIRINLIFIVNEYSSLFPNTMPLQSQAKELIRVKEEQK